MKRLATVLLAALSASALPTVVSAQFAPQPRITSVPQRKSYAPGNVAILGSNLGLVVEARVNGVAYPIVRATSSRLVVGPVPPQDPGFGTVQVLGVSSTASAPIALLPTLAGVRRRTSVDLALANGDTGTYVLRYAYSVLGSPAIDQGIYGKRFLQINSPVLAAGVFADANPVAIHALMPVVIGQIGSNLRLQAECTADTAAVQAYTNLLVLPGFSPNPLP